MGFEELKQRHAAMWGAGPFERIAHTLHDMHEVMIDSVEGGPDDLWLDIGCGTGEMAFLATRTGATIHGTDISSVMVETARRQATDLGHDLVFEVADCEALPYPDASYDVVTSSVGVIFAPDHAVVAAELARVVRPGGRLALTAWTAGGQVGEFFALIGRYSPPPTPGAGSSLAWGDEGYCRQHFGEAFDLDFTTHDVPWIGESAEDLYEEMATAFGPIVVLLRSLEPERAAAFRAEMLELFGRLATDDGVVVPRPFLLVRGIRREDG
jgi:ubiquinone/menaquinone biosynthesis C-methylase UbiE